MMVYVSALNIVIIKRNSNCSKITIAVFESGCYYYWSKNINQINTTYDFINNLVNTNIALLKKDT